MIGAKFGDPVIGIDIHRVMVPTPAGPVSVPLPHCFVGVVFDPLGAALSAAMSEVTGGGGLVLINGMPCTNTGTEVKGLGHVPTPPGVAPDPGDIPANEGTLVSGSKTVLFGGASQSKLICFLTGHPVDVVTGELYAEAVDFELPGMIPIVWERNYRSRETEALSLGPGWYHPFDMSLDVSEQGIVMRLLDGRPKDHPPLGVGASLWDDEERYTLTRTDQEYELTTWDGLTYTLAIRGSQANLGPEASTTCSRGSTTGA